MKKKDIRVRVKLTGTRRGDVASADKQASSSKQRAQEEGVQQETALTPENWDDRAHFPDISDEQIDRKKRSMTVLASRGIQVFVALPCIESLQEVQLRPVVAIIQRVQVLFAVSMFQFATSPKVYAEIKTSIRPWLSNGLYPDMVTPSERVLLEQPAKRMTIEQTRGCGWKNEEIWFLLYLIQVIDLPEPPIPETQCDLNSLPDCGPLLTAPSVSGFLEKAKALFADRADRIGTLREVGKLLDYSDLLYRFHWYVRNSMHKHKGNDNSAYMRFINLHGIVTSWRTAIDWVLFPHEYDEVPMDT
eukprot:GILK01005498.1.p1 GENE.GILK01005498.1~~GILK01005498.1.p1  ORF type:complete len:315 (-),score=38.43 GILK01005498.1:221-1129(-)